MAKYEIIIYWSYEDECFLGIVPELGELMAHGDTQEECLKEINIAISLWLEVAEEENMPIPVPKGKLMYA